MRRRGGLQAEGRGVKEGAEQGEGGMDGRRH